MSPAAQRMTVIMLAVLAFAVAVSMSTFTLINNRQIANQQKQITMSEHRADYRLCSRGVVTNAVVDTITQSNSSRTVLIKLAQNLRDEQGNLATSLRTSLLQLTRTSGSRLRLLASQISKTLPVMDCSPNLVGEAPHILDAKQTDLYIQFLLEHHAPPVVRHRRVIPRVDAAVIATNPIAKVEP
jgi:hypothetical protein